MSAWLDSNTWWLGLAAIAVILAVCVTGIARADREMRRQSEAVRAARKRHPAKGVRLRKAERQQWKRISEALEAEMAETETNQ
jgi:hypothetical protein